MARRKGVSDEILRITDGLVGSVTNLILLNLYTLISLGGVKTMGDAMRMVEEVHGMLDTVNYQTIKSAIHALTAKGYVKRSPKYTSLELVITELGYERIKEIIPTYKTDRPWDGHIYLISYDIPKTASRSRDLLREYVRRTGGALLQESLWIDPYNPTLLLEEFVDDHEIPGTVLVSKLGSDGTIGDETFPDLIVRVYHLDKLAQRYKEFLETYRRPTGTSKTKITIDYLAILKDDPQLPFILLPKDFPAEAAWKKYRQLIKQKR